MSLRDFYNTPSLNDTKCDAANDRTFSHFNATSSYGAVSVKIKVFRVGSPGTVTIGMWAALDSVTPGHFIPTGSVLASNTFNGNTITTDTAGEWIEIVFSSTATIVASSDFGILMNAPSSNASNYMEWKSDDGNQSHPFAIYVSSNGGASYSRLQNWGSMYEVYDAKSIPNDKKYTRNLVTFSANKVFYGPSPTDMTELAAASGNIDTSLAMQATEAYGKVFIANGENLRVADFVNIKVNTTSIGSNVPNHGNILTGGTSVAKMVTDYIDANSGDTNLYGNLITTAVFVSGETVTGTNNDGDAVSFVLSANQTTGPHWYDWTVYAGDESTYGSLPTTASIIELHIGSVWLMGDSRYPHQWYKSRQNNPWDYLYAQDDAGSAVAGNDTDAGEVGDIIVDAISYSDDYMVIAGSNELYVIIGNPAAGGRIDLLRNTGLVAAKAWTWDDEGNLFMLSNEGLLRISKGFGEAANLTKEAYPDFIEDLAINPSLHRVSMGYDSADVGILITKTTTADGVNVNWWYDTRTGGLFKYVFPKEASVFSMWRFAADDPADSALVYGCNDGYVREFLKTAKSDDIGATDEAIDAYVGFGPFKTSEAVRKAGRVSNIDVRLGGANDNAADDSDDVAVKVYTADNPEKIIKDMVVGTSPRYTKTHKAAGHRKGNVDRRKVYGRWFGVVVGNNTAGESFSIEKINFDSIGRRER